MSVSACGQGIPLLEEQGPIIKIPFPVMFCHRIRQGYKKYMSLATALISLWADIS